jgi:hypothetical protein
MTDHPAQRARYLVELAVPEAGWVEIERMMRLARAPAGAAGGARFIRSIFVPEDSRLYLLYEADSADQALRAAAIAELDVAGTVEALRTHEKAES